MGKLRQNAGKGNMSNACWLLDIGCFLQPESVVPKQRKHPSDIPIPMLASVPMAELLTGHTHPQAKFGAVSLGLLFL